MNDYEGEEGLPSLNATLNEPIGDDDAAVAIDFDLMDGIVQALEVDNDAAAADSGFNSDDYDAVEGPYFEPTSVFPQEDQEAQCDVEEDDFFDENYEKIELPHHLKDQYLENLDKQMNAKMTPQDFERSQFEVHGISTSSMSLQQQQQEDPEMVTKALHDMDGEIQRLMLSDLSLTEIYRIAELQSQEFVTNKNFRLLFLRCELFDVEKAAKKLMRYFHWKDWVWGREKLTKKITLSDFEEDDWECLSHGHSQLLPIRDHAGRSVIFNNANHLNYRDGINQIRTLLFLHMVALEDKETQKNGIVFVNYKVGEQKGNRPNRQLLWKAASTTHGLPVIFGAFHLCFGRQSLPFVRLLKLTLEYQTGHRVRVHEGSQTEVLTSLMTFGIPRYAIPVSADGEVTTSYHLDWLEKRLNMEKEAAEKRLNMEKRGAEENDNDFSDSDDTSSSFVRVPGNCDVLLGRGKRARFHPGNIRYNMLLEEKSDEFDRGNRKAKQAVKSAILHQIKVSSGGRFLRRVDNTGLWEVVNEKDIGEKISHDFRSVRQKKLSNKSNGEGLLVERSNKKAGT